MKHFIPDRVRDESGTYMSQVLQHIACSLAGIAPSSLNGWLRGITTRQSLFPFYHLVSDAPVPHIRHLYHVRTVSDFRRDLEWILQHYKPLDPNGLLNQASLPEGFVLSFDDGLREVHEVVLPVLREKGIRAVCFLNPAFIGNGDLFFRYKASLLIDQFERQPVSDKVTREIRAVLFRYGFTAHKLKEALLQVDYARRSVLDEIAVLTGTDFKSYLNRIRPYMDESQVKDCIRAGMLIGAHSMDHPRFSELSLNEQLFQARESVREVQIRFGLEYGLFAFPFTDAGVSATFFNRLWESTDPKISVTFGCAGLKQDSVSNNIQRIPMEYGRFQAKEVINGAYLYYLAKAWFNRNIIIRS